MSGARLLCVLFVVALGAAAATATEDERWAVAWDAARRRVWWVPKNASFSGPSPSVDDETGVRTWDLRAAWARGLPLEGCSDKRVLLLAGARPSIARGDRYLMGTLVPPTRPDGASPLIPFLLPPWVPGDAPPLRFGVTMEHSTLSRWKIRLEEESPGNLTWTRLRVERLLLRRLGPGHALEEVPIDRELSSCDFSGVCVVEARLPSWDAMVKSAELEVEGSGEVLSARSDRGAVLSPWRSIRSMEELYTPWVELWDARERRQEHEATLLRQVAAVAAGWMWFVCASGAIWLCAHTVALGVAGYRSFFGR